MKKEIFDYLKRQYDVDQWFNKTNLEQNLFVWKFFLSGRELPQLQAETIQRIELQPPPKGSSATEGAEPLRSTLVRSVWERRSGQPEVVQRVQRVDIPVPQSEAPEAGAAFESKPYVAQVKSFWSSPGAGRKTVIEVTVQECPSRKVAHEQLLQFIAQFQLPNVNRREGFLGDVAFTGPRELFILFARGNLVCFLRNAGLEVVPVTELAQVLDQQLTSKPEVELEKISRPAARLHLESTSGAPSKGEGFPLNFELLDLSGERAALTHEAAYVEMKETPVTPVRPVMYKVFSAAGETILEGDQLVYRPDKSGPQEITLFAIKADEGASGRDLQIDVE